MQYKVLFFLSYLEYEVEGVTYMRMKFYVSGSKRKGEAVLDLKKVRRQQYIYTLTSDYS